jgi:hypothetical protein
MHATLLGQLASNLLQQAVPVPPPAVSAARSEAASAAAQQASRLPPTSAVPPNCRQAVQQPQQRETVRHAGLAASTIYLGNAATDAVACLPLQPQQQAQPAAQALPSSGQAHGQQSALLQALLLVQQLLLEGPPASLLAEASTLQQAVAEQLQTVAP